VTILNVFCGIYTLKIINLYKAVVELYTIRSKTMSVYVITQMKNSNVDYYTTLLVLPKNARSDA